MFSVPPPVVEWLLEGILEDEGFDDYDPDEILEGERFDDYDPDDILEDEDYDIFD